MVFYNVIFNFKSLVYRQTDDDVILFTSKMTSTSSRLHSFMLSLLKSKTLTNIDQSQKSNGDENKTKGVDSSPVLECRTANPEVRGSNPRTGLEISEMLFSVSYLH